MSAKRRGKKVICFCMMILLLLLCACTNEQKPTDDVDPVGAETENYEIGNRGDYRNDRTGRHQQRH